ncbi:MAG: ATPase P [Deltaproteobacteria bacterium]|nr:ATPase P [Deltaproteobacteria bacterium]
MITVEIPGRAAVELAGVVFDMNGTLTIDGVLGEPERQLLRRLGERLAVYVLTADTFGTAAGVFAGLPLELHKLTTACGHLEKRAFLAGLGADRHAAVGNGFNDHLLLRAAAVGVCVLGREGAHPLTLGNADLVVPSTAAAIELFLDPRRLVAGLRS